MEEQRSRREGDEHERVKSREARVEQEGVREDKAGHGRARQEWEKWESNGK